MSVKVKIGDSGSSREARVNKAYALSVSQEHRTARQEVNLFEEYRYTITGMNVDGSATPQSFTLTADGTGKYDLIIQQVEIFIADSAISYNRFGNISGVTNGWDFYATLSGNQKDICTSATTNGLVLIQSQGEKFGSGTDLNKVPSFSGTTDALLVRVKFDAITNNGLNGIRLAAGSVDSFTSTVNDNFTGLDNFELRFKGLIHYL